MICAERVMALSSRSERLADGRTGILFAERLNLLLPQMVNVVKKHVEPRGAVNVYARRAGIKRK